jgi:hypothetical protein
VRRGCGTVGGAGFGRVQGLGLGRSRCPWCGFGYFDGFNARRSGFPTARRARR